MRIFLADDQRDVRLGLRVLLEQEPELEIVGEAATVNELLKEVEKLQPDLLLLDWELPEKNIVYTVNNLHSICPDLKIIALSGRPETNKIALMMGADAFVSKCDQPEKLIEAISEVRKKVGKKICN
ncbi:MAG: response regulator transcription factor [Clostridia bacterium]|nr:response regulator transcription factor [Clostridia bacterium]